MRTFLLATVSVFAVTSAQAATRTVACSGNITSALQAAINASGAGDIVSIGAGTCSMDGVSATDRDIQINGQGINQTNITANNGFGTFAVTGDRDIKYRISGMSLTGSGNPGTILVFWGDQSPRFKGPFRIDHMSFDYPNQHSGGNYQFWGPLYGLVDHNTFKFTDGIAFLTGLIVTGEYCSSAYSGSGGSCNYNTLGGGTVSAQPFDPGGPKNIYFEDNTVSAVQDMAFIDSGYTGTRAVLRHNTFNRAMFYGHWTEGGNVNTSWWEVYENTFNGPGPPYPMRMQGGGTGLIYNNRISGFGGNYILVGEGRNPSQGQSGAPLNYCDGRQPVDGNAGDSAAPGWPCLAQTGRAAGVSVPDIVANKGKQQSYPLYLWHNGPEQGCLTEGGQCSNTFGVDVYGGQNAYFQSTPHPNGDVDWFKSATKPTGAGTHTLTYTPLAYPYPLAANGMPDAGGGTSPPIDPPPGGGGGPIDPPPTGNATSLFAANSMPQTASDSDTLSVELGMKFSSSVAGNITGVRFYKGAGNTGTHSASLWSNTGTRLANGTFANETASGWQTLTFANPVAITAGTQYVVSYHAPVGRYAADSNYFRNPVTNAPLSAPGGTNGVYKYGAAIAFPTDSYQATNYWVDVVFAPTTDVPPPVVQVPVIQLTALTAVNTTFTYGVSATNMPTTYTATGLPAGLSINATTGVISGTPTTAGIFNIVVTARNSAGSDTETLVLTVR